MHRHSIAKSVLAGHQGLLGVSMCPLVDPLVGYLHVVTVLFVQLNGVAAVCLVVRPRVVVSFYMRFLHYV